MSDGPVGLRAIMYPRSIAVVGASDRPDSRGHNVVTALLHAGYAGTVYAVGRRGGSVHGLTIFPSLADIPGPVDLVASQVSIAAVPEILEHAPRLGFKGLVIYADGFGDLGEAGARVEAASRAAARQHGVRIIGPNTMGLFCARSNMDVIGSATPIPKGPIGFISQSGNVGITVMLEAHDHGSGLSHFWGIGRQGDVELHECMQMLAQDDSARVIAIYAEGIRDGAAFLDAVREITPRKPIVMLKAGATRSGARAAASHSGSLAAEDRVLDAACRQAGAIRVLRSDELVPVAIALAHQPAARGRRVALLGSGGGHCVEMGDAAERAMLEVPPLSQETAVRLRAIVPPFAGVGNPSDFAGGLPARGYPMTFADAAHIGLADPSFDGLIMFGLWGGWRPEQLNDEFVRASERIAQLGREADKPVVMHTIYAREPHAGNRALQRLGVPTVESIEVAARCFAALAEYGAARGRLREASHPPARPGARAVAERLIASARAAGRSALLEAEAQEVLTAYGVPALAHGVARTRAEVAPLAQALGFPVAVKVHAPTVLHKSDVGGVHLGVRTSEEAERAFEAAIATAASDPQRAAIVYRMAEPQGLELLLGLWRDALFGPVVVVGLGGIFAEILNDISLGIAPFGASDAEDMLDALRGARLLAGARGRAPVSRTALVDALLGLAQLGTECPEIAEVDVNPLFAHTSGVAAADARVILR